MNNLNQVNFKIQSNVLENLIEAVENMRDQMPGLANLTASQKQSLLVPGDKTTPFIDKALEYAERTPDITPGYIKIDEWQTDVLERMEAGLDATPEQAEALAKVGANLTKLSNRQSEYLGIPVKGPFKPEAYRY